MSSRRSFRSTFVLVLAIALVTVTAIPAVAHLAPWQARGAYWAPAPAEVDHHGFALRLETVEDDDPRWGAAMAHHGSISFSPEQPVQADELDALSVDVYLEEGACANGSPRFNLRVDTDGDGNRDIFVQAYPDAARGQGCPEDTWVTLDVLADDEASWLVPGHGYLDPSQAQAQLASDHPDHAILRVDLQWDNTEHQSPAVVYLDDITVHQHRLAEPTDGELVCPATVEDPLFGGFGACPFTIT